jgi:hypothetical protein
MGVFGSGRLLLLDRPEMAELARCNTEHPFRNRRRDHSGGADRH